METTAKREEETIIKEEKKRKRKWLRGIANFLMFGGWILVAGTILGIVVLISSISD